MSEMREYSVLSYTELCELIEQGVIQKSSYDLVNSASIDIRLGNEILSETNQGSAVISLAKREAISTYTYDMNRNGCFILAPNEFVLAHSIEVFNLPNNISAEYKLKSSMARMGLEHMNAGWCDAGWHGSVLTLELKNLTRYHNIMLNTGDKIGQMIFYKHNAVPEARSYAARGSYNRLASVSATRTERK